MASSAFKASSFPDQIDDLKQQRSLQRLYCSVCHVILNSSSQADAHYAGKSHRNKAKMIEATSSDDVVINSPALLKKNLTRFECTVCEKYFNSSTQLKQHRVGKAHQSVAKSKIENPVIPEVYDSCQTIMTPISATAAVSNASTVTTVNMNVMPQDEALYSDITIRPNSAMTKTSSQTVVYGKNLSDQMYCCTLCNITLNSMKQLEQHKNGLRHKIMMGEAELPGVTGEKWENARFMKISNAILGVNKDDAAGSGGGVNIREFRCEKCNLTVNSKSQLNQHLDSNKHKVKDTQANVVNKRKRPNSQGSEVNIERNNKRPSWESRPGPLSNNFVHSNTYIPAGGGPLVYRLPHLLKLNPNHNLDKQNCTNNFVGNYDTNVAMF